MRLVGLFRRRAVLVLIGAAIVTLLVVAASNGPRNAVSLANYQRIQIGMSQVEVSRLLGGPPQFQKRQLGRVDGPDKYVINFGNEQEKLRNRGFRDYEWQQWHSGEITIAVVSDLDGIVVCRYSSPGQSRNWTQQVWSFVRRVF